MNGPDFYSDEQLQSFVDDELGTRDRADILEAARKDENLTCRICELMQIKDTVRLAYRETAQPAHGLSLCGAIKQPLLPLGIAAAVLVFVLGAVAGNLSHHWFGQQAPVAGMLADRHHAAQHEIMRMIIHISTEDEARLDQALTDAEQLLAAYREYPARVQLEVVANTRGLSLLRTETSPFPDRIARLARQYENISFLACSRTIEKLRMRGIDVHLLPEAEIIPGALEEIVDRMQQGWVYIRV